MADFQQLGKFLKEKRISNNYTQAGLAEALGEVHTQFVSNWERGMCAPPGHCFQKLIDLLRLNREDLVEAMLEDSKRMIESKVYKKKGKKSKAG